LTERIVFIEEGGPRLECLLEINEGPGGVVIAHPHPLYGGDMYNQVVETVSRAYSRNGITTVRFNFRGVGGSGGAYDNGVGEREDVGRVIDYLSGIGKTKLHLVGYSFGAWVNALAGASLTGVEHWIMVSPPVAFLDFEEVSYNNRLSLVIAGSEDYMAPESMLRDACRRWNPSVRLEIVPGADHFYCEKLSELGRVLDEFLQ
jgi:uncharacterized protein